MILSSFLAALGQWTDARFRRVVLLGVALTLALLVAVYALMLVAIQWLVPETTTLPLLGPVGGLDTLLSFGSILLMLLASVFLMVPVASAFTGLFLEDVVDAVEDRHFPTLPDARPQRLSEGLIGAVNFFGIALAANLIALFLWPFAGPLVPVLFWSVNGYLLGREYFTLVAQRRIGRDEAKALWRANKARIWGAGVLMAAPLSIPLVNLLIPVFGVATFTHLFHRLNRR
ncbi:EI24 domain-containing protein [Tabrizicola sp. M-4]|uniref:EI24 domain-containing protein n=1 Tax=Tabrizicola sp. M-4 TaxID=3055847 RepID=UPI003DA89FB1